MNNNTTGIKFNTLEKMCDLFDCEIGELIVFNKNVKKETNKRLV